MPFTPFHLGPGFALGMIFKRWINLPAILIASIFVDIRATYCFFTGCTPLHGPLHTLLGATLVSLLVIAGVYALRSQLKRVSSFLKIEQDYSLQSISVGALVGVWVHIALDAFLYSELALFWPFPGNPLAGMVGSGAVYGFCVFGFVVGGVIYAYGVYKKVKLWKK
ncbi:metal-dependent hydrolase [archaeon]|nr:metal-dependent hydrolase [archaeon]